MIHYLKIQNFGPIKHEVLINFEVAKGIKPNFYETEMPDGRKLLKLAYIYGANASGKTTVLNAFKFLKELLLTPLAFKGVPLPYYPFESGNDKLVHNSSFELSFYANQIQHIYFVEFNLKDILNERLVLYESSRPVELFSRKTDTEKQLSKISFGNRIKVPAKKRDLLEALLLHNNTVLGAFTKANFDIPELQKLNIWFSEFLMNPINSSTDLSSSTAIFLHKNPEIKHWVNTYLKKADIQITEVTIPEEINLSVSSLQFDADTILSDSGAGLVINKPVSEIAEFFQTKIGFFHTVAGKMNFVLPLIRESSGTKRYFGLSVPLYQITHENHFLCIDELDTSLHPELMKHFLLIFLIYAEKSQLLITTHNISLMTDADFIRRDALWFSEKTPDGSVSLYSVSYFDTATLKKGASLIKVYNSGKLGGKPNPGLPFID